MRPFQEDLAQKSRQIVDSGTAERVEGLIDFDGLPCDRFNVSPTLSGYKSTQRIERRITLTIDHTRYRHK